ncbi:MAG: lipopolysaccharide biosynthesis protein, partial [Nitrospira sp.]|nr:lipopolysaccharide biosynthesis protein [Nitrospira sp.]
TKESPMKRLVAGSVIYGLGNVANKLVTLLLLPIFTTYLTPEDYGVVSMLTVVGGFTASIFALGLGSSIGILYFDTREPRQRQRIIWNAAIVLFASAMIMVLAGFILATPLSWIFLNNAGYAEHTKIALASAAAGIAGIPWQLRLQFEERPVAFVIVSALGLVATTAASLWFVVMLGQGAIGALTGSLVGQLVGTVLLLIAAADKPPLDQNFHFAGRLIYHGLPFIPSFGFLFLLQNWVRWPLEWHHGLDDVGIYSVGANIGVALGLFVNAFLSAWTPFALSYAGREDEAAAVLGRITLYYVAGFGFLTCLFFLYAAPVVQWFTQPTFARAAEVVGLSAVGQFLSGLFMMMLPPLYFAKRVQIVVLTQAIATTVVIGCGELIVPRFGIHGAAISVVLGFLVLVVIQWVVMNRLPVVKIRYDLRRAGFLMLLFGVVAAISFSIDFASLGLGLLLAIGVTIGTGAVVFLQICRLEEILLVMKRTPWLLQNK